MPKHILILMAMSAEASPLISRLSLTAVAQAPATSSSTFSLPYETYTGSFTNSMSITLLTSGKCATHGVDNVGTLHAGLMTMYALREVQGSDKYDLVLNAGTCGGFISKGCSIGSVCIPEHAAFHDRRITIPGTPFEAYGDGKTHCHTGESGNVTQISSIRESLNYLGGGVTTGDSLDHTAEDMLKMMANGSTVKDMEGAAIAKVCELAGIGYLGVKVVTDLVDGERPAFEEFLENLGTAAKSLEEAVPKILEFLDKEEKAQA
jgi:5'-methylthioadenosine nucleosidase